MTRFAVAQAQMIAQAVALAALLLGCGQDPVEISLSPVVINELNPSNHNFKDDAGSSGDWVELFNTRDMAFDLSGYYLSDSVNDRFKGQLPANTIIPGRGALLVWVDGQNQCNPLSPHLPFKLSSGGDGIWLSDPRGYLVDFVEFPAVPADPTEKLSISYARFPDATGRFRWCTKSTPAATNGANCGGQLL